MTVSSDSTIYQGALFGSDVPILPDGESGASLAMEEPVARSDTRVRRSRSGGPEAKPILTGPYRDQLLVALGKPHVLQGALFADEETALDQPAADGIEQFTSVPAMRPKSAHSRRLERERLLFDRADLLGQASGTGRTDEADRTDETDQADEADQADEEGTANHTQQGQSAREGALSQDEQSELGQGDLAARAGDRGLGASRYAFSLLSGLEDGSASVSVPHDPLDLIFSGPGASAYASSDGTVPSGAPVEASRRPTGAGKEARTRNAENAENKGDEGSGQAIADAETKERRSAEHPKRQRTRVRAKWVLSAEALLWAAHGPYRFDFALSRGFWNRLASTVRSGETILPARIAHRLELQEPNPDLGQWLEDLRPYWCDDAFTGQASGKNASGKDAAESSRRRGDRGLALIAASDTGDRHDDRETDGEVRKAAMKTVTLRDFMLEAGGF